MELTRLRHDELEEIKKELFLTNGELDIEDIRKIEKKVVEKIGNIETKCILDIPMEAAKYCFGPFELSACFLSEMIARYKKIVGENKQFREREIDDFCNRNNDWIKALDKARDSILHELRGIAPLPEESMRIFNGAINAIPRLIEGEKAFRSVLIRIYEQ